MRFFLLIFLAYLLIFDSCNSRKRNPEYMPDMGPSLAYDAQNSTLDYKVKGINFNAQPVQGTICRDAPLPNGLSEDDQSKARARKMQNPLNFENSVYHKQGKYLYGIHCAPCHGEKLDGNGILYNGGDGPFPAKPPTLLPIVNNETDGSIFYTISFGKNMMGSFRDRLSEHERWLIVGYIRKLNNQKK